MILFISIFIPSYISFPAENNPQIIHIIAIPLIGSIKYSIIPKKAHAPSFTNTSKQKSRRLSDALKSNIFFCFMLFPSSSLYCLYYTIIFFVSLLKINNFFFFFCSFFHVSICHSASPEHSFNVKRFLIFSV